MMSSTPPMPSVMKAQRSLSASTNGYLVSRRARMSAGNGRDFDDCSSFFVKLCVYEYMSGSVASSMAILRRCHARLLFYFLWLTLSQVYSFVLMKKQGRYANNCGCQIFAIPLNLKVGGLSGLQIFFWQIHFSGHGTPSGEFVLQDVNGRKKLVSIAALAQTLKTASEEGDIRFLFFMSSSEIRCQLHRKCYWHEKHCRGRSRAHICRTSLLCHWFW